MAVAWAYAYQGLENKVVVYLPGDTPWRPDTRGREIPAPGLCSTPRAEPRVWEPTTAQHVKSGAPAADTGPSAADGEGLNPAHNESQSEARVDGSAVVVGPTAGGGGVAAGTTGTGECGSRSRSRSGSGRVNLPDYWWKEEDVQRYSNWDKSNLFVAGSRCLSQLIMLIP